MKDLTVAVVGATGAVGTEFLRIIEERHPEARKLKLLASSRSAGQRITVNGRELTVEETTEDSFEGVDIAFISVSSEVSRRFAPCAVDAGAVVIDDGSAFRMEPNVPLVVPEVNGADVEWHQGIISIPNCSTTPLVMVVHPLRQENPVLRIVADTYQSVSGTGGKGIQELAEQTRALLEGKEAHFKTFPHQIAFNVLPEIDALLDNGYFNEEWKMIQETRKIMHAPDIAISATAVRVPVYVGHSEAVHLETTHPMSPEEVREVLSKAPGVRVVDDPSTSAYPLALNAAGTDEVYVGRIRKDVSHPNGIAMWVVADNVRKGAALNAVQIAEILVSGHKGQ